MCRLTAYVGEPAPLEPLVYGGDHSLLRQAWEPRELLSGSVNADGWGIAWLTGEGFVRLARTRPVWQETDLAGVLASVRAPVALAALRNATPGLPVDEAGLLPVVVAGRAFVLNGAVPDFRASHMRALRAGLPDDLYALLAGVSDAETLALLAVAALREGATRGEALSLVVRTVLERTGDEECQLTLALADGEGLTACRTSDRERTNSLWVARGPALTPGGTLLASERLDDDPAWAPVPPHALLDVTPSGLSERPLERP